MVYAAIGGMQLKHWSGYFKIIVPTMKVLSAAKRSEGCVRADTFKSGDLYFAVSVWQTKDQMRAFAQGGLHGQLTDLAMDRMALFYNRTEQFESVPTRDAAARDGKGTVGTYGPNTSQ